MGPVFALLGFPALFLAGWRSRRHAALAGAAGAYLLLIAALLRWQVWHGRILITFVAFVAPLLPPLLVRASRLSATWSAVLAAACASCLFVCATYNQQKALLGYPIWDQDRLQRLRAGLPNTESMLRLLDGLVPPVASVTVAPQNPGEARYPLFGPRLDRRVRPLRLDREATPSPGEADALLISGETAAYYLDGDLLPGSRLPFAVLDMRPHLERLRQPGSGWRAVADSDESGHLFVPEGRPLGFQATLAEVLPLNDQSWGDRWVGPNLRLLVRFDPARPRLALSGEMPDHGGPSTLTVGLPKGEAARTFSIAPGPFEIRVPLGALRRARPADYVGVEIRSDRWLNPARRGFSADTRDLAWRMARAELVAPRRRRGATAASAME
jgi:hypothetical protein